MNIYEKDYSELDGLPIEFIGFDKNHYSAVVVGCDANVGITIMSDDKETYLFCMVGPSVQPLETVAKKRFYRTNFLSAVGQIRKGKFNQIIDCALDEAMYGRSMTHPFITSSATTCPFNQ